MWAKMQRVPTLNIIELPELAWAKCQAMRVLRYAEMC